MFRWKYLIPRLVILVCFVSGLWVVMNPALRWALIQSGQSATGAKIEIRQLRSLFSKAEIQLEAIKVADPQSPMQNLFEADAAVLDIDLSQLMRRRLVINEGHLGGVQIGTTREHSGALPGATPDASAPSWTDDVTATGEQWLEQAAEKLGTKIEGDLKSVEVGRRLIKRWPEEYSKLETEMKSVRQRGKRLVEAIKQTKENPIQPIEHYHQLLGSFESLRHDTVGIRERFGLLQRQMQLDGEALEDAKEHDVRYVQQHLQLSKLDPADISDYLLGPEMGSRVAGLIQWLQWGRQQLSTDANPIPPATRGWNVLLPEMNSHPSVLVRKLMVDGGGSADGQPFTFEGTVEGLTSQPSIYGKPATVNIRTDGSVGMLIQAILDHTSEVPKDHLVIRCPQLKQPARQLGSADKLAVQLEPGSSDIEMDLDLTGNELNGIVRFHQPSVNMRAHVSDKLGGQLVSNRLSEATSAIEDLRADIRLGGTLRKPSWKLDSNLGDQLAAGLSTALTGELAHRREQLLAKANTELDGRIQKLQREIIAKQDGLLRQLDLESEELNLLKNQIASLNISDRVSDKLLGEKGWLQKILRR